MINKKTTVKHNNRMTLESKLGVKTRLFGNANSVTWNLKRRFN